MTIESDQHYLARRIARELVMVEEARCDASRAAHRQLAELYAERHSAMTAQPIPLHVD